MAEEQKKATPAQLAQEQANSVPPNLQEAFTRVVKAGMKVMFSEETHQMMVDQLSQEGDLAQNIGEGIAGLMMMLFQKSKGTMPQEVIVPAGVYLMMKGADFLEQVTGEEMTIEVLSDAMEVLISSLLGKAGVDKGRFQQTMQKAAAGEYAQ